MSGVEVVKKMGSSLFEKFSRHIDLDLICREPLKKGRFHVRIPDCPLALGVQNA
ncbi:uncharacterized protein PHALS_10470 [Plasmopara halstedii]|uniref:Uncharacterized protein n=1 Tax=Plasmopara halstedii TaxID=4781 RepID=A0A0P1AHR9_PLAHL|nr:uncharacterized protein PHALS_10470 [Plasmopara halstedii]CEG40258.1 hypothetical protein PHALS_10470 [Plasmopara halstedii]|eukprot:XP_024576627.1 hypothetical protein PHALS_10470 [Plasmopara halstedii]